MSSPAGALGVSYAAPAEKVSERGTLSVTGIWQGSSWVTSGATGAAPVVERSHHQPSVQARPNATRTTSTVGLRAVAGCFRNFDSQEQNDLGTSPTIIQPYGETSNRPDPERRVGVPGYGWRGLRRWGSAAPPEDRRSERQPCSPPARAARPLRRPAPGDDWTGMQLGAGLLDDGSQLHVSRLQLADR